MHVFTSFKCCAVVVCCYLYILQLIICVCHRNPSSPGPPPSFSIPQREPSG